MIDSILLAGFLGAGKTALPAALLSARRGERLGVILNGFGEINVDAKPVEGEGVQKAELSNGSIFCACSKDKFVDSLIEMSCTDNDRVLSPKPGWWPSRPSGLRCAAASWRLRGNIWTES